MTLPADGHCRCGNVRIRITRLPIMTMACHCRGCQRMSASAYSLSAAVPSPAFEIVSGEPVIGGLRNPELRHYFCPSCMSWMFTRTARDFVNVRPTMLEDLGWFTPFIECWTRTRLPWARTPAVYFYEEFPPLEDYARLTAEFARMLAAAI